MELQNNLENKAKFFAQYWGQNIVKDDLKSLSITCNPHLSEWTNGFYLELTPLSDITDEDAIEVAKICDFIIGHGMRIIRDDEKWVMYSVYNDTPYETVTLFFHFLQLDIFSRDEAGNVYQYDTERILMIIDYLRSRGYVLPWLDTTLEKQIEYGWVKLKTLNK